MKFRKQHETQATARKLDKRRAKRLLGKSIIIGLTFEDHEGNFLKRRQLFGKIVRINLREGIVIQIDGTDQEYALPPHLESLEKAPPGEYRLKSTGQVVLNPDLLTTWTVTRPPSAANELDGYL